MSKLLFTGTFVLTLLFCHAQTISTFPFTEDFEAQPNGSTACGADHSNLGNTWQNGDDPGLALPLSSTHQSDWTVNFGPTGSSNTGPSFDHTTGTTFGKYMYTETSGCNNLSFELISPYLDFTTLTNPLFELWYHSYGVDIGLLYVDAQVGSAGAWVALDSVDQNIDLWQQWSIPLSAYIGVDSLRLRIRTISGPGFESDMAIDDLSIFDLLSADAGVLSIDAPINPITPGPNNIDVTLGSFGADTLTSATIEWSVDGIAQSGYSWTGSLGYQQSEPVLNIGNYSFTAGLTKVKVWSSMPNNVPDTGNLNDTTSMLFCTPLGGSYTLGGPTADFEDFIQLGDILSNCGVMSSVEITVNPGTYFGSLILDHVPGVSSVNTITINGVDTSLVTLENSVAEGILLNGTSYTTIKNMTLDINGISDVFGVRLADTAMYNTLDSLFIKMEVAPGLVDVIGVSASGTSTSSFTEGQKAMYTMVSNCHIYGGEKAIHFEGENTLRTIGNKFHNNFIEYVEDYGFYIDDQDSIEIIGNTIENILNLNGDAIYLFDLQMFDISYNVALNVPDWGIYISDGNFNLDGIPASRGRIANNMISSVTDYACYFDDFEQTDVFHNTFYGEPGIYMNDIIDLDIRNNIFISDNDFAFESADLITATPNVVNSNLYWTPATNALYVRDGGVNYADLTTWQAASPTLNAASLETDPVLTGNKDDMHVLSPIVNDQGDNSVGITDDFEGDMRPMGVNVDMGADEFSPNQNDLVLEGYILPEVCGDSTAPLYMIVRNLGASTVTSFDATAEMTGDNTQTVNYTYSGSINFNNYDTVLVGTLNTYWGQNFNLDGWVSLAGDTLNLNDSLLANFSTIPYEPIGIGNYACGDTSTWIYGTSIPGVAYNWFASSDQVNDTVPLTTSDSLLVPNVLTQGTYYIEYANFSDSLSTPFNANNGAGGNMFDVVALNQVNVTNLDMNFDPGTLEVQVWYREGTWVGNETNPNNDWILLGTSGPFNSLGINVPTPIPVSFNVSIPAGQTYAFYVQETTAGNLTNYTNGVAVGNIWAQNSEVQILEGCGKGVGASFTTTVFQPRNWNGILHYGTEACSNNRIAVTAQQGELADPTFTSAATNNSVDFTSSSAPQNTAYFWDFGDGSTDSTANPTHVFTVDSTYTVCLTASSVCGDSTSCDSLTVCAPMAGDFAFGVSGGGYSFDFSDISTGTPTSWMWDFGDGNTSTMQNPSHTYASTDSTYTVTLTVTNLCGEVSTSSQTISVVDLESLTLADLVKVYPNPSNGQFTVSYQGPATGKTDLTIVDNIGRIVYNNTLDGNGNWSMEIDLSTLANGTYFLTVSDEQQETKRQLVKVGK